MREMTYGKKQFKRKNCLGKPIGGIIVLNEKERRRLEQRYEWNNIRRK